MSVQSWQPCRAGANTCSNRRINALRLFASHSHTTTTRQPRSHSRTCASLSRATLERNFSSQNRTLIAGLARRQPRPCQKHPWTNTTAFASSTTTSGVPGKAASCVLYTTPACVKMSQTISSGRVSRPRIRAIWVLRSSGVSRSKDIPANRAPRSTPPTPSSRCERRCSPSPSAPAAARRTARSRGAPSSRGPSLRRTSSRWPPSP